MSKPSLLALTVSLMGVGILSAQCGSSTTGNESSGSENGSGSNQGGGSGSNGNASGSSASGSNNTGGSGENASGSTGGSGQSQGSGSASGNPGGGSGESSGAGSGASSGSAGGSGTPAGGSGSTGPVGSNQSVLQRGGDTYARDTFDEPGLSIATAPNMAPDTTFNTNATFPANGNMQNEGTPSVLYVEDGPTAAGCPTGATGCTATGRAAGAGMFIAFAAHNSTPNVFAFDETTGMPVWTAHVAPGGDGIRGTPVIDGTGRKIYIATGAPHALHAVSLDTGVEITTGGFPATMTFGGNNDGDENQHGALALLNNIVYVPFGGHYGDGGNYNGWIQAVNTGTGAVQGWSTQSSRSGIWGAGGLATDGSSSVFGVTGDTGSEARAGSDSQEVVRITGMASFTRSAANVFVPVEAPNWDRPAGDLDFGASTPAYVPLPGGSNPSALLVAPAKAGRLFILNGTNLSNGTYDPNARSGSNTAPLADLIVSGTTGETVYTSPTIYTDTAGLHATINVGGGSNCPGGNIGGEVIVSTLIKPGSTPIASGEAWCSKVNAGSGHMNFPPISTSDGVATDPSLVWFIDGSQLRAVNGDTGANVVTTTGAACNMVPSMSFPIAVKNRIVVWAIGHLCSWSVGGN